jgi:hypothetical protein
MDSPANCNLLGTIAALREAMTKKTEITMIEKKTSAMGLVVYSLCPTMGARLKSAVLGGTKPGPTARWPIICTALTHLSAKLAEYLKTDVPYSELSQNQNFDGVKME